MAQIKISKEELQHDEVLETTDKALRWIKAHSTTLLSLLAGAFLVYAVAMFFHSRNQSGLVEANNILADAQGKYSQALVDTPWASAERDIALNEVVTLADQVIEEYSDTPLASQALYLKGTALYMIGDDPARAAEGGAPNTERAIDTFIRYLAEAETPFERGKGGLALGYAYENQFFLTGEQGPALDAINTYKEIEGDEDIPEFLRAEAKLAHARILAYQMNEIDEAAVLYREVIDMRKDEENRYKLSDEQMAEAQTQRQDLLIFSRLTEIKNSFSAASTARLELQRLGFDVEEDAAE